MSPWLLLLLLIPLVLGIATLRWRARPIHRTDLTPLSLRAFLDCYNCSIEVMKFGDRKHVARFTHFNGGVSKVILCDERGKTEIDLASWPGSGTTEEAAIEDLIRRYNSIEAPEYVTIGQERPTRKIVAEGKRWEREGSDPALGYVRGSAKES